MKASLGRITASLEDPVDAPAETLTALINERVRPERPINVDDIHVRAMFVVSDEVNSFGGRFPLEEHQRLVDLLIDTPVLVGHRKDKLPIGRTFHAELASRNGRPWVKAWFYWLKSTSGAEDLKENIDGGIYRECSIAFMFNRPECSICGRDIRTCEHEPFGIYRHHGRDQSCHFNYRKLDRVLETSLVYRGAVPGTAITRKLASSEGSTPAVSRCEVNLPVGLAGETMLTSIEQLDPQQVYVIVPRYPGIPVVIDTQSKPPQVCRRDGTLIDPEVLSMPEFVPFETPDTLLGLLVGYRGKSRRAIDQLENHLAGKPTDISHLTLFLLPHQLTAFSHGALRNERLTIQSLPFRHARFDTIKSKSLEITTALGVEIYPLGCDLDNVSALTFHPDQLAWGDQAVHSCLHREVIALANDRSAVVSTFEVPFDEIDQLAIGHGKILAPCPDSARVDVTHKLTLHQGTVFSTASDDDCRLAARPVRLGGELRMLLHKLAPAGPEAIPTKHSIPS